MESMSCGFYVNPDNVGPHMSLDETCLSNGEVWTFLTNKDAHGQNGTLAAAVPGTKSDTIIDVLVNALVSRSDVASGRLHATCPPQ